jgi:hypothetical protein
LSFQISLSLSLSPWVRFQTHYLASQRETLVQFSLALPLLAGKFQALPHLITDLDLISVFCFEYSERERERDGGVGQCEGADIGGGV